MRNGVKKLVAPFAFGLIGFVASFAEAQTSANGPYYATPSWDQKLQCDTLSTCPRFVVLSNLSNGAVLDRESGLVWAQSTSSYGNYQYATTACQNLPIGNRVGWRLPTVQELMSLIDPSAPGLLKLPAGHPFTVAGLNPASREFWTLTAYAYFPLNVWVVDLSAAPIPGPPGLPPEPAEYVRNVNFNTNPTQFNVWCVRSPYAVGVE